MHGNVMYCTVMLCYFILCYVMYVCIHIYIYICIYICIWYIYINIYRQFTWIFRLYVVYTPFFLYSSAVFCTRWRLHKGSLVPRSRCPKPAWGSRGRNYWVAVDERLREIVMYMCIHMDIYGYIYIYMIYMIYMIYIYDIYIYTFTCTHVQLCMSNGGQFLSIVFLCT